MQFKVGEKVRFLHENQEGVITQILGGNKLEVIVDDFFELEVNSADVVKIDSAESRFVRTEDVPTVPQAPKGPELPPALLVAYDKDKGYAFWVHNPTRQEVLFSMYLRMKHKFRNINAGLVQPGDSRLAGHISRGDFNMSTRIQVQCLRHSLDDISTPLLPFVLEVSTRTEIMGQKAELLEALNIEGFRFPLEEQEPEPIFAENQPKGGESFEEVSDVPDVIDLHIHKIIKNTLGLTPDSMMKIQMEHFDKVLSNAIMKGKKQIVFIHGIGDGTLKKEVHNRLRTYNFVKHFELADPVLYGNGATIVQFSNK